MHLSIADLTKLVQSKRHEERLISLHIAVYQYQKTQDPIKHKTLYDWYMLHRSYINNRDLVDTSAEHIV